MNWAAVETMTLGPPAPPVVPLLPIALTAAKPTGLSVGAAGPLGAGEADVVVPPDGVVLTGEVTRTSSNSAAALSVLNPTRPVA